MKERIDAFIAGQTVLSLCYANEDGEVSCCSCFYAYNNKENLLYFKSSSASYHSRLIVENPKVAGTILPDKLNKLAIKGIQFMGAVLPFSDPIAAHAAKEYHTKYPFALAMPGDVWTIKLDKIKMTDNTLGFAKKITWQRDEAMHAV